MNFEVHTFLGQLSLAILLHSSSQAPDQYKACVAWESSALLHQYVKPLIFRDGVQPPVFVTAARCTKRNKKLASTWLRVGLCLLPSISSSKHKRCASPFTNVQCWSTLLIWIWILTFCICNSFFTCSISWTWSSYWHWWLIWQQLALHSVHCVISTARKQFKNSLSFFSIFCLPHTRRGGRSAPHVCIWYAGSKHLVINITATAHSA